jgi:small redox-active disulfide protein 2
MNIKVLGPGCSKCKTLEKLTHEVVAENNFDATVEKIDDIMKIMEYGIMRTPGLVINDKIIFSGRVPSKEELKKLIENEK